jgi:cytochrome c-type biogenesis protein CcmH
MMTTFWIVAGVMVGVGMLFVALPLLRRAPERDEATADRLNLSIRKDQLAELEKDLESGVLSREQFEQGRLEIERGLLAEAQAPPAAPARVTRGSRWVALVAGLIVPLVAMSLYAKLGNRDAMAPIPEGGPELAHQITAGQLAAMVQRLADRLKDNPDDADGWAMLGRSYAVLHRYQDAAMAYARAYDLIGDNPDVLADYGEAISLANNGEFTPDAKRLIERAIQVDPTHRKALWLLGTIAFEEEDYPKALDMWQRLAPLFPAGSEMERTMQANIAEVQDILARQKGGAQTAQAGPMAGGMGSGGPAPATSDAPAATAAAAQVSGTVELDPSLKAKVPKNATLFIFARAAQGPRMPLAIIRRGVPDFPVDFTLDRSMSMMAGMSLADFPRVVVGARISASGGAMPASGDLQGLTGPIAVGSSGVKVVISEVVP